VDPGWLVSGLQQAPYGAAVVTTEYTKFEVMSTYGVQEPPNSISVS